MSRGTGQQGYERVWVQWIWRPLALFTYPCWAARPCCYSGDEWNVLFVQYRSSKCHSVVSSCLPTTLQDVPDRFNPIALEFSGKTFLFLFIFFFLQVHAPPVTNNSQFTVSIQKTNSPAPRGTTWYIALGGCMSEWSTLWCPTPTEYWPNRALQHIFKTGPVIYTKRGWINRIARRREGSSAMEAFSRGYRSGWWILQHSLWGQVLEL